VSPTLIASLSSDGERGLKHVKSLANHVELSLRSPAMESVD